MNNEQQEHIWDYAALHNSKMQKMHDTSKDKINKTKDHDITMTNPLLAKHLISLVNFENGDIVIEPCKGSGSFIITFQATL